MMNERDLKDFINCESADKEKMIEAVKEKLRWYTFEASEEEFDAEAVDALVRFLREAEPELGEAPEIENDIEMPVQKKRVIKFSYGKIAAAVVVGVLALTLASVVVGNSLGTSLAWEDGGFFKLLRKDKSGQILITSSENLGIEDEVVQYYYETDNVPVEYRAYLIEPIDIDGLVKMEIEFVKIHKARAMINISANILVGYDERIECGITIFEDELRVVRNSYDEYDYQYSIQTNKVLEIYEKKNKEGEKEYAVVCYENNNKIYVLGQLEVDILVDIAESYLEIIEKNQQEM